MSVPTTSPVVACRPVGDRQWREVLAGLGRTLPAARATGRPRYQRILVPLLVGASDLFAVREGLLGHALRLRGALVRFVVCDGLQACDARTFDHDPEGYCGSCLAHGEANIRALGHEVVRASAASDAAATGHWVEVARATAPDALLLDAGERPAVAPHVFSSTLRYLRAGRWEASDVRTVAKGKDYLEAALLMREYARAHIAQWRPDKVLLSHGVYSTWGPWADEARAAGVPFDTCCGGWRRNTLFLQHDDPRPMHCNDIWSRVASVPLSGAEQAALDEYLSTREDNRADAFQYIASVDRDRAAFLARHAIDRAAFERVVGVFSNVAFDSARFGGGPAFPDMFAWLHACVDRARTHPQTLFLVKAHPAELTFVESTPEAWRVGQSLRGAIASAPNVRFIPPDDPVSPYVLYGLIGAGLVNTSSVGLEMALHGLPVLTSGAGVHYEQDGVVIVPRDRDDYFARFDALATGTEPFRPDADCARRYAYTLYFRKSMPFEAIDVAGWSPVGLAVDALADLGPGRWRGLDGICDGILEGTPFVVADAHA